MGLFSILFLFSVSLGGISAFAQEVNIAFVGDVILHDRVREREEKTNEGYQVIWKDIQKYLSSADVSYANLEGPVAPAINGVSGYPMFNYPEKIIPNLKDSGFDVVSTSNNHSLDRSAKGISATIENLNKYNLNHTGTVSSPQNLQAQTESWWTLTEISPKKYIAWLACTEMTNGIEDKEKQILYCYKDEALIQKLVKELSVKDSVVAVFLTPHWGVEDKYIISDRRRLWANMLINSGATAIVGSHPHVVQKIEKVVTENGRLGVVNYSLGNFVSNQPAEKNRISMIFYIKLQLSEKRPHKAVLKEAKAVPIWMTRTPDVDATTKYSLSIIWDFSKYSPEVQQIWSENIAEDFKFKNQLELDKFLNF